MMLELPMAMLYPCTIQECSLATPKQGILGTAPRDGPRHWLGQQADHRHRGHAFPATGLADDAERAAALHLEGNLIDGPQQAGIGVEGGDEVPDFQQWFFVAHFVSSVPFRRYLS
jgi:hypothetical protein